MSEIWNNGKKIKIKIKNKKQKINKFEWFKLKKTRWVEFLNGLMV
jgi:hypothetical protein